MSDQPSKRAYQVAADNCLRIIRDRLTEVEGLIELYGENLSKAAGSR